MDEIVGDNDFTQESPRFLDLLNKLPESNSKSHDPNDETGSFKLDLEDLEDTDVELDDYDEPVFNRIEDNSRNHEFSKAEGHSHKTILMQPEMRLLLRNKEREKTKPPQPEQKYGNSKYTDEQKSLLLKFPWLAEKLKIAWDDLEDSPKGMGKIKSGMKQSSMQTSGAPLLKNRTKKKTTFLKAEDEEKSNKTKIVFSRNIPLLIYNNDNKKCIKLGGDRPDERSSLEEVYRAVHFNPELKRITLDLEDLRFPEKERTLRIAMSYISANTLHNPYVISEDMCKFSHKKEVMIKFIVDEIEKRLHRQNQKRIDRKERQKKQDEEIRQAKEEEELRGRDFITANKLLEQSKNIDTKILTDHERRQERQRRIRLRTKSMPTNERLEKKVKQRRAGVSHISLNTAL